MSGLKNTQGAPQMLLFVFLTLAHAIDVGSVPNPRDKGTWVVDLAGIIDTDIEVNINSRIEQLHKESDVEIALVTIDNVSSSPKAFATELFNHWGIGDAEKNNGLLVLMVIGERRLEMETGYGLESVLSDGWLGSMQTQKMVPKFKQGDFGGGLEVGIIAIDEKLRNSLNLSPPVISEELLEQMKNDTVSMNDLMEMMTPVETPPPIPSESNKYSDLSSQENEDVFMLVGGGGVVLIIILGLRAVIRKYKRRCPTCKIQMIMLSEEEDDKHLDAGQRTEERIGSIDHQYYTCSQCGFSRLISDGIWFSGYGRCSSCSYKALSSSRTTMVSPTYTSGGRDRVTENCSHCSYHNTYTVSTPKLTPPSSSSSGGSSSGGSSGGGSSFGGGSSGGGGAGSSW
jgi:uncharacterized protein